MSSPKLPTNRHFVTQLFNSLPAIPPPPPDHVVAVEPNNPLSGVPDAVKKQLLSLQVLFPNEFVPALDLLDRRLVTRFRISDGLESVVVGEEKEAIRTKDAESKESKTHRTLTIAVDDASDPQKTRSQSTIAFTDATAPEGDMNISAPINSSTTPSQTKPAPVYYVRSAQQQRASRYSTSYDTTTSYEVRLQAWNCSCPAFAFSAFPATHSEPRDNDNDDDDDDDNNDNSNDNFNDESKQKGKRKDAQAGVETAKRENTDPWSFGGVSLGDGMPPVCKHLLACVLVDKGSGLFSRFVEEREVSVEEAAAWAAGWGD